MRSPKEEETPLTLVVQRLMDADLLLQEEGAALLAVIATWGQPADSEDAQETGSIRPESRIALEALVPADWSDSAAVRAALETARAIVKQYPINLAGTPAETGEPRD
jgi:hypothetical protein